MRAQLHSPRLMVSAMAAALTTALLCWAPWPGFMSYDSFLAYRESLTGIWTATTPPMHAYLFALFDVLHAGVGALFFGQAFILFFAAAIIIAMLSRSLTGMCVGYVIFVAMFVYFPPMWGTVACLWKDVPTASFALLGIALWLVSKHRQNFFWLCAAFAAWTIALALRYNSLPLLIPVFIAATIVPLLSMRQKIVRVGLIALCIALATASTSWRIPDFKGLPPEHILAATQLFDLLGISACSGEDFVPAEVSGGQKTTPAEIRELYDPRHVQLAFVKKPGVPQLHETDAGGKVEQLWPTVVRTHLGCYFAHRTAVFREQMGMVAGELFYPTHGGIDPNPFGIHLAHPGVANAFSQYISRAAIESWRRPVILYLLAVAACILWCVRRFAQRDVVISLTVGSLGYVAGFYFTGPTAEARYIFPSSIFCALTVAIAISALSTREAVSSESVTTSISAPAQSST